MTEGHATVHGTVAGFFFFGFSHQHCWFEQFAKPSKETVVVESGGRRAALQCPACHTTVILGSMPEAKASPPWLEEDDT